MVDQYDQHFRRNGRPVPIVVFNDSFVATLVDVTALVSLCGGVVALRGTLLRLLVWYHSASMRPIGTLIDVYSVIIRVTIPYGRHRRV